MPFLTNQIVANLFSEIADMLEILGENIFRIRAYRRAAESVRAYGLDLKKIYSEDPDQLGNIPGIGEDLQNKILEIIETGECSVHEKLSKRLPAGILDILRVRGIGPRKVKLFYEFLQIDSLEKLEAAAETGELAKLPGMGEKSQEAIIKALAQNTYSQKRLPFTKALRIAEDYLDYMRTSPEVKKIMYAGSLRRKAETIGDIDLLATTNHPLKLSEHFCTYPKILQILAQGATKSSVVLKERVQVDLRVVEEASFGAALLYFTGNKDFNIRLRTIALRKGLKINEYGLFRGEEKLAGRTEEEMFEALGIPYLSPEDRLS